MVGTHNVHPRTDGSKRISFIMEHKERYLISYLVPLILFFVQLRIAYKFLSLPVDWDLANYMIPLSELRRGMRFWVWILFHAWHIVFGVWALPLRIANLLLHWTMLVLCFRFINKITGNLQVAIITAFAFSMWSRTAETYAFMAQTGQIIWICFLFFALLLELQWLQERKWYYLAGAGLSGIASAFAWEHGPIAMISLIFVPFLWRKSRYFVMGAFCAAAFLLVAILFIHTPNTRWIYFYLFESSGAFTLQRIVQLCVSLFVTLRLYSVNIMTGGIVDYPPGVVIILIISILAVVKKRIRSDLQWNGFTPLLVSSFFIFAAGMVSLLLRLPLTRHDWYIISTRHAFFVAPALAVCAAAWLSLIWNPLSNTFPRHKWVMTLMFLSITVLFFAPDKSNESKSVFIKSNEPYEGLLDALRPCLAIVPRNSVIELSLSRSFPASIGAETFSAERIGLNVGFRLNRPDLTFRLLYPGEDNSHRAADIRILFPTEEQIKTKVITESVYHMVGDVIEPFIAELPSDSLIEIQLHANYNQIFSIQEFSIPKINEMLITRFMRNDLHLRILYPEEVGQAEQQTFSFREVDMRFIPDSFSCSEQVE